MKNIVITGSSSGFGYLTALSAAKEGHKVWATMRNTNGKNAPKKKELEQLATNENLQIKVIELDVSDSLSIEKAINNIVAEDGNIDVLVNNAGFMFVGITEAYSIDQIQQQFDVNFFGIARMIKAVSPHMRKAGDGLIINTTSLAGRLAFPYFGIYCASKHAVEAYSQSLRYELAPFGVEVSIVEPGPFGTNLLFTGPEEADKNTIEQYGDFKEVPHAMLKNFESFFNSEDALDPQLVADDTLKLIQMEKGTRPARTVSGIDYGTVEYNEKTQPIQDALIKETLQMEHLLTVAQN
ncbi:short-chain dehydrogenase/reductase [Flagellimonas aquimarina]|uniref:Short-chain dehydrogenase/reductase n=1 Tax=Flagellimonas aquimarina TaxID=2201895 RepID=A0A316L6A5_9FLAO|nr:SDR family oxidoreductase [Allomuricauda koreensis]PWL40455.1 short-chain dehydrogenase/reductase [Allomuricauda koreensis]